MRILGNLHLEDVQLHQMCLSMESQFPLSPIAGRVVFKDKRVWICIETSGSPVWVPLGPTHDTFVHEQTVAATSWTVQHNFDTTTPNPRFPLYPLVQVYDDDGNQFTPDSVSYVDDSTMLVEFGTAVSGTAVCMYGDEAFYSGLITPQYAFEHTQTNASDSWVIRHWLGYVPAVHVFSFSGDEVLPLAIVADDAFQVTIRFSSPVTGTAKMV